MVQFQYPLLVLFASASAVSARPAYVRRQVTNTSFIAVTGASQGGVQPRLEVHDLQEDADQWNIYLLALQSFQQTDPSDPISWYQIAGIHGVPYVDYDGVELCSNCTATGYCTHSSTLFPTWHRAYLAIFERSLQNNALTVANQFSGSDKSRYLAAATNLRMPYWDWALLPRSGEAPFPSMFTDSTVNVNTPNGQQTIANPLLQYSFGSADHSFMATPSTHDSDVTYRNPKFNGTLSRQQLRHDLWITLTSNQGYTSFSTESLVTNEDNRKAHSLEMVHDLVHVAVGGDMGYVPTAAFDPVFWLHHAMVDRAFALWQAAYPNEWIVPWSEVGNTYTYAKDTVEDSQSPLTPFHQNLAGLFWNSDVVRDTTSLNYNYADLASGESAAEIINLLYHDNEPVSSKRSTNSNRSSTGYIANIETDAMGSTGSFTVFLFDGEVDDNDPSSWWTADSLFGIHGFFTGPRMGDGSTLVHAGISLNPALGKRRSDGALSDMSDAAVSDYLRANLEWRIQMLDGSVVALADFPHLEVAILASNVQMPTTNEGLPAWGELKTLTEITQGKPCGLSG